MLIFRADFCTELRETGKVDAFASGCPADLHIRQRGVQIHQKMGAAASSGDAGGRNQAALLDDA